MMTHNVIHSKLSEGRRIALPAELCRMFDMEPGDPIVLEAGPQGIMVRPADAVLHDVQAFFADAAPRRVLLSESLLADRRAAAKQE